MNVMILLSPVMTIVMNVTVIAVLWFGGKIVLNEAGPSRDAIGDLPAFVTYVTQILSSLMMITAMLMMLVACVGIGTPHFRGVGWNRSIWMTVKQHSRNGKWKTEKFVLSTCSFRYDKNSAEEVLHDINLTIPAHTTVGIIGSTGCGKSTLVSMIPRLYDCDQGRVLIDGIDVKDYSLYHLREGVGMVLQKNVLFSGSIADNLRWGDENADDETVRAAAKLAQADGFVTSFPDGYQTDLVEGGTNVSGGQKQRLCIARALLKKPKILILDDSTSAVDTATEAQIRTAFRTSLPDATKIIIAQRITSVMDADLIVVMDEGGIVGTGTHTSLLQNNETYREIYDSQMEQRQEVRA